MCDPSLTRANLNDLEISIAHTDTVRRRTHVWLGHTLRYESSLHDIFEGRMRGKATRGQKRMHLLSDLMKTEVTRSKARSSRRSRLENCNVINLLVAAED